MTKNQKIWVATIVALILVFVGRRIYLGKSQSNTIKIGFIGPLTGDVASWGVPARNGLEIATDDINAAGGVSGKKFNVIYEDGKCTGKDAVSAAQKLINATLTDKYLQHEAIKAQEKMAGSPNHTQIYIPVGQNGIPIVKTLE